MVADERIRGRLQPALAVLAGPLARVGVRPTHLTALGLTLALGAAWAVAGRLWLLGLALWLLSRLADGLDGSLARRTGSVSPLGGLLDLMADFLAYGAFVVGVGVALPDARVAVAVLLLTYYLNGSAFLAVTAIAERRGRRIAEGDRSLQFVGGLTEGFETIVAHALIALVGHLAPGRVALVVWVFAAAVAVTVLQRLRAATEVLRDV